MKNAKSVEEFLEGQGHWEKALRLLREIALSTGMEETVKWGIPVFTVDGKNVAGIAAFKSYAGLWFYQGALLKDEKGVLINATETTKALKQWRFQSFEEIDPKLVKAYMLEAVQNQKEGREIKADKNKPLVMPPELGDALSRNKKAESAFESLNLTRKREYVEYIATAKRDETKLARLEKIIPMILEGKGLNDKYR